jgi:hypothetical protein
VDDLKLIGGSEEDLRNEIRIVKNNKQQHKIKVWIRKMCQNFLEK